MIRHLKHNEINKTLWDERLMQCPNARVYACSWYLDIVSPGWEALIQGDYEVIMPLCVKSRLGLSYIGIPAFTQQLGVFSIHNNGNSYGNEFLDTIPNKIFHYDLFFNAANKIEPTNLLKTRTTQVLQLEKPFETLYKSYSENLKRNLKKSAHFKIVENLSPIAVVNMFSDEKARQIKEIKKNQISILERIVSYVVEHQLGYCVGVINEKEELLASGCFVKYGKRIYYLKGSSTEEGKQNGAMHLLLNNEIEKNAGQDCEFDFSGSVIPGLHRFYKSFGAVDEYYHHIKYYKLPKLLQRLINLKK